MNQRGRRRGRGLSEKAPLASRELSRAVESSCTRHSELAACRVLERFIELDGIKRARLRAEPEGRPRSQDLLRTAASLDPQQTDPAQRSMLYTSRRCSSLSVTWARGWEPHLSRVARAAHLRTWGACEDSRSVLLCWMRWQTRRRACSVTHKHLTCIDAQREALRVK